PFCETLARFRSRYEKVIVLAGNHELYKKQVTHEDLAALLGDMYYREGAFSFRGLTWFVASFHEEAVCNQIPENVAPVHIFVTHIAALGSPGEGNRNK